MSGKSELLQKIMRIDRTIYRLNRDNEFRKIKQNIRRMENPPFGKRTIRILSPDDLKTELMIRKKTRRWKMIKNKYDNMRREFEDRISSLYKKRNELENKLFYQ